MAAMAAMALSNATEAMAVYLQESFTLSWLPDYVSHGHLLLETILIVVIVTLMISKSYKPNRPLSEKEIDSLCEEWQPEPLHPPVSEDLLEKNSPILECAAGPRTVVNGKNVLNLAAANLLDLLGNKRINEAATAALHKYGVGSCGPRGFYGTIDVHMDLEQKVANFMGVEDCILYSYGMATASSTIPAFCKLGDVILVDEGVNWSIQNGLKLSKSTVKYFRHNDMEDLESKLMAIKANDRKVTRALTRRFILVEAIYQNSGQLAPLDELVRLKEKYFFRILVDESLSFGVLGKTGRGLSEHFGIEVKKLDIIVASMGNALASEGGFCCGAADMVDHQRLSGLGYCFSASQPPFLASAAIAAIDEMELHPELRSTLNSNITTLREALVSIPGLRVGSSPLSPIVFVHLEQSRGSYAEDCRVLQKIVDKLLEKGVFTTVMKRSPLDPCRLPAAIRLAVSAGHKAEELLSAAHSLRKVSKAVLL